MCLCRCDFEDTAQYRASAMNVQGELSAYASVVVKSRFALALFKVDLKLLPMIKTKSGNYQLAHMCSLFFSRIQGGIG